MKKVSIQHVLYLLVIIGIIIFTLSCKRKSIDKTIIKRDSSYVKKERLEIDSSNIQTDTKYRLYNLQGNFDYNIVNESFDIEGLKIKFWKDGTDVNKIHYKIILKDTIKEVKEKHNRKLVIEDSLYNKKSSDIKIKETIKPNYTVIKVMLFIFLILVLFLYFYIKYF